MTNKMKFYIMNNKVFFRIIVIELILMLIFIVSQNLKRNAFECVLNGGNLNLITGDYDVTADSNNNIKIIGGNGNIGSKWVVCSDNLNIPYGMYEIQVNYSSKYYTENGMNSDLAFPIGVVFFQSNRYPYDILSKNICLYGQAESAKERLWIKSPLGVDDLCAVVDFYGESRGDLSISNIIIKEITIWRFTSIIALLVCFIVVDFAYLYFADRRKCENKIIVLLLSVIIVFSSMPLFADFVFFVEGHDFKFHLTRIWMMAEGIKNGHWIVPIQAEAYNGYGSAVPLFYNQLFLYIPAILYCLAVPLQMCYQIYVLIVNASTCLITYFCIKKLVNDKYLAVFAAMIYTMSAYRICNIYVRAALGEYTAMVFLPLILYGFIKVYMTDENKITWREYIAIVIGLTGIIGCHVLSCEMVMLFIVGICLIFIKSTLKKGRFIALLKAALLTLGINFGFFVPFLSSMKMDLNITNAPINIIQRGGAYLIQVAGIYMTSGGENNAEINGDMPLSIGFSLILGIGVFIVCYIKKYEWDIDKKILRLGTTLTGAAIVSIVFSLKMFPWDRVYRISERAAQIFGMIQFPWRYLAIGTVLCVFSTIIGIKIVEKQSIYYKYILMGIISGFTLINIGMFYMRYADTQPSGIWLGNIDEVIYAEGGMGTEYLPNNTSLSNLKEREINADADVTIAEYSYLGGITRFDVKNNSGEEKTVEIPLLNYDNYHAYDISGGKELEIINGSNNRVGVIIPSYYEGEIEVKYVIPFLWKVSYAVSAITIIGILLGIGIDSRRNKRTDLSANG